MLPLGREARKYVGGEEHGVGTYAPKESGEKRRWFQCVLHRACVENLIRDAALAEDGV